MKTRLRCLCGESHLQTFGHPDWNLWLNHARAARINLCQSYRKATVLNVKESGHEDTSK
jgi:hypothetical protein